LGLFNLLFIALLGTIVVQKSKANPPETKTA
jgi:hypothetical protein